MSPEKKSLLLPVLLITIGTGWLLSTLGIAPEIDWVWTLGLAVIGLLTFAVGGFDKFTVVIGPFFILASGLSVLRQTNRLQPDIEIPIFVIAAGVLLMIARTRSIPIPNWIDQAATQRDTENQ
ncbi:hypothetical protein FF011L_06990 [Roseimaritima multifibrata]|uniref:Uncharacterized protein n=1 Tax=Roseimaritima multifibrata TaxID=1930274 RepID=A0A517MAQ4_9BACT|nr:hypothetical protein [Roseimaritima multifibrata]QDS91963.1 hypothetical protein FF011L_06990 [Roseimaritima multifibrata]